MNNKICTMIVIIMMPITIVVTLILASIIYYKTLNYNKKYDLTQSLYTKMMENDEYHFAMENDTNYKTIIARKGSNVSIDMYSENYHTTTLTKTEGTYVLMHGEKQYSLYSSDDIGTDILTDELDILNGKDYDCGKEKINNKNYRYEEYDSFSAFLTMSNKEVNENDIKTRFYFDNNDNLVYIKTITADEEELLNIEVSFAIDDKTFDIPEDYVEL